MLENVAILTNKEIKKLISMPKALALVEKVFIAQAKGKIQMPAKIYLHLEKFHGDFRAMPAYIEGMEACGIKWVNVHPENKKFGLPAVMALIILSNPKNGLPLAIMEGTYITNLRTGAAGGIAAKYLANKNSSKVSLIGCGKQAQSQLLALNELFKIKSVRLYDYRRENATSFIKIMKHLELKMEISPDIKACLYNTDIAVTTTPSRRPIIKSEWITKGMHINAIGADAKGKEELDPKILKIAKIFVDDITQARHSGEINVPISKKIIKDSDLRGTLGEVLIRKKKGRSSRDDVTIFDSTGLAIQDLAVANFVYKKSLVKKN